MTMRDNKKWQKNWQQDKLYADIFKKRATGELPEMESSRAAAKKILKYFKSGYSMLDVGCGAGHYLNSYDRQLKGKKYTYVGIDASKRYVDIAKKVYAERGNVSFRVGSIYKLPFKNKSFDIVVCNNVLLHLPEIKQAIKELNRVAKKVVIIRTLVGYKSYYIKNVCTKSDFEYINVPDNDPFYKDGSPKNFFYFNIYSKPYIEAVVKKYSPKAKVKIEEDRDFDVKNLAKNKKDFRGRINATELAGSMQASGYILLPWAFVTIEK
ncbi:MAG: class I SAM-dependent methyltransferase [Parcubacteria group bacterium]|nr:class I SAM-dependent methyltransferase [Parcubacteria group bacterium]